MSFNLTANKFDPPPKLGEIFSTDSAQERLWHFKDFLFYKEIQMKLPLTDEEQRFGDTVRMFGVIPADGWTSVFDEQYSYPRLGGIIEVFRYCDLIQTASVVEEARGLFYNGRTDLMTPEARRNAGIRGFRHPTELKRLLALGEQVEQLPYTASYHNLLRWPEANRERFVDFPRESRV